MPNPSYFDADCGHGSSLPLVPGAARGLRVWRVDEDGWLRGVTYRQRWAETDNEAVCYAVKRNMLPTRAVSNKDFLVVVSGVGFPLDPAAKPSALSGYDAAPCSGVESACGCGFYAYHQADHAEYATGRDPRVVGIIEGYGRVVLGPYGFRAEKARLVALVLPEMPSHAERLRQLREVMKTIAQVLATLSRSAIRLGRNPRRMLYLSGVLAAVAFVYPAFAPVAATTIGAMVALAFASEVTDRRFLDAVKAELQRAYDTLSGEAVDLMELAKRRDALHAKVLANYPNVQVYGSKEELLQAHPLEDLTYLTREVEE